MEKNVDLRCSGHEIFVEKSLSFGQMTFYNMFIFVWHLLLYIFLDSTKNEWTKNL